MNMPTVPAIVKPILSLPAPRPMLALPAPGASFDAEPKSLYRACKAIPARAMAWIETRPGTRPTLAWHDWQGVTQGRTVQGFGVKPHGSELHAIDAERLERIAKSADNTLAVDLSEGGMEIYTASNRFPGVRARWFLATIKRPIPAHVRPDDSAATWTVRADELFGAVKRTLPTIGTSAQRTLDRYPAVDSLRLDFSPVRVQVIGTDGHRISTSDVESSGADSVQANIPTGGAKALADFCKARDEDILTIEVAPTAVIVRAHDGWISIARQAGAYPPIASYLDHRPTVRAEIDDTKALGKAITLFKRLASKDGSDPSVVLTIGPGCVNLTMGEANVELRALRYDTLGRPDGLDTVRVALDPAYLYDAINPMIGGEYLTISYVDKDSPVGFSSRLCGLALLMGRTMEKPAEVEAEEAEAPEPVAEVAPEPLNPPDGFSDPIPADVYATPIGISGLADFGLAPICGGSSEADETPAANPPAQAPKPKRVRKSRAKKVAGPTPAEVEADATELTLESRRADHLATITGDAWVVVRRTGRPIGDLSRHWTYDRITLDGQPIAEPHEIVYTAEPPSQLSGGSSEADLSSAPIDCLPPPEIFGASTAEVTPGPAVERPAPDVSTLRLDASPPATVFWVSTADVQDRIERGNDQLIILEEQPEPSPAKGESRPVTIEGKVYQVTSYNPKDGLRSYSVASPRGDHDVTEGADGRARCTCGDFIHRHAPADFTLGCRHIRGLVALGMLVNRFPTDPAPPADLSETAATPDASFPVEVDPCSPSYPTTSPARAITDSTGRSISSTPADAASPCSTSRAATPSDSQGRPRTRPMPTSSPCRPGSASSPGMPNPLGDFPAIPPDVRAIRFGPVEYERNCTAWRSAAGLSLGFARADVEFRAGNVAIVATRLQRAEARVRALEEELAEARAEVERLGATARGRA